MATTDATPIRPTGKPPLDSEETKPPAAKKRQGGPGRKRSKPEASELPPPSEEIDLLDNIDIFEQMKMYPEEEWREQLSVNLHRVAPFTDRDKTGNFRYIQKFAAPFTQDEVMKSDYGGSGKYKIYFNRWNPTTRTTTLIRNAFFEIFNINYPPRVPLGEWVDNEKNKDWLWCKPYLEAEARKQATAAGVPTGQPVMNPTSDSTAAMMPNLVNTLLERALQKDDSLAPLLKQLVDRPPAPAGDNNQLLTTLLLPLLLKMIEQPKNTGTDPMLAHVLAELAAERAFNRDLLMKQTAQAAPQSPEQVLQSHLNIRTMVNQLSRGNPAQLAGDTEKSAGDWTDLLGRLGERLIDVAPTFFHQMGSGGRIVPQARPLVPRPRTAAAPADPAATAAPPQEETTEMLVQQISNAYGAMFDEITPFIVDYYTRGLTGMDFRDWFIDQYGHRTYGMLIKLSPETITDVIEHRKQVAPEHLRPRLAELAPPQNVFAFVKQFLSTDPAEDEDEDSDDEPTQAQPAAAAAPAEVINPREKDF